MWQTLCLNSQMLGVGRNHFRAGFFFLKSENPVFVWWKRQQVKYSSADPCWNVSLKQRQLHILKGKWSCSNLWPRSVQTVFCYLSTFFCAVLHTSLLFSIVIFLRCSLEERNKLELLFKEIRLRQKTQKCLFIWSFRHQQKSSWLNRWNQFAKSFWNCLLYGEVLLVPEHFSRNLKNRLVKIILLICYIYTHTHSDENDKQYFMWSSKRREKVNPERSGLSMRPKPPEFCADWLQGTEGRVWYRALLKLLTLYKFQQLGSGKDWLDYAAITAASMMYFCLYRDSFPGDYPSTPT